MSLYLFDEILINVAVGWMLNHHHEFVFLERFVKDFFFQFNIGDYMLKSCFISISFGNAGNYVSFIAPNSGSTNRESDNASLGTENGFLRDIINPVLDEPSKKDDVVGASTSEQMAQSNDSGRLSSVLSSIRELVRDENCAVL